MATGGTLTQRMDDSLPARDHLKVHGTGISPRPPSRAVDDVISRTSDVTSGRSSPISDSAELPPEEAYNVLQSVVSMNRALEGQIDALRLRLDVESKHHTSETEKILQDKNKQIQEREEEIGNLKDSLVSREERIQVLVRTSSEKDKLIEARSGELMELRKLVKQTEEYAGRLYKQVGRLREDKRHLETDTLYKEQNIEIKKLRDELKELREKCGTMERELDRAKNIITQQNLKIAKFENEKNEMAKNFKDELDKASRAMRQEVERMREVMNQNYEEMRNLREQNRAMHDDVRDIKDLILQTRTPREGEEGDEGGVISHTRPLTSNINMSTYMMHAPNTHSPAQRGLQKRSLGHPTPANHRVQQPQQSPSPIFRANTRTNLSKPTRSSSIRIGSGAPSRSAGHLATNTSSPPAELPPISLGPRQKTRWPSAAPTASRNQRLNTASSAKRGDGSSKK